MDESKLKELELKSQKKYPNLMKIMGESLNLPTISAAENANGDIVDTKYPAYESTLNNARNIALDLETPRTLAKIAKDPKFTGLVRSEPTFIDKLPLSPDYINLLKKREEEQKGFAPGQVPQEVEYWNNRNNRNNTNFPNTTNLVKTPAPINTVVEELKPRHQSLMKNYGFDNDEAIGILDSYLHPDSKNTDRQRYFREDMLDTESGDEFKKKLQKFINDKTEEDPEFFDE